MRIYTLLLTLGMLFFVALGTVVAAPGNFSGGWDTTWNGGKLATRLSVTQSGNKIAGTYTYRGGHISGVVEGNVAVGTWWQDSGERGAFRFDLSADGESFKGQWRNASAKAWEGTWNGVRR